MQSLFEMCSAQLKSHHYADAVKHIGELARTAESAAELLMAARVADIALYPGLELRLVRRAIRTDSCPASVILYQSATYLEHGRYLEAEESLTPYLQADDWTPAEQAKALGYLAVSYAARRRFQSAATALERAVTIAQAAGPEPLQEIEYYRLTVLAHEDRWEACTTGLNTYIEASGGEPRAYLLLALCHEHLGQTEEVLQTLQTACNQFPEYPGLWLRLFSAAWALGESDQAKQAVDRVAALLPGKGAARRISSMHEMLAEAGKRLPVSPIRQGHNHCFPASLAMVLAYYGRKSDQRAVGSAVMDGQTGTPLFQALHYLEQEGWVARTFRATPERVKALIDRGVPPLLGLEWAGGAHVHVCVGYDDECLYIQDPSSFHRRHLRLVGFDHVYAHSDYWALAFVPPESAELLDVLPCEEDAAIRQIQACWEHLSADRLDEAKALFAQIDQGELMVGTALFRLRVWPRLGNRERALEAVDWVLGQFPDHRQIRLEVAQHLARLDEEDRALAIIHERPGRLPARALMMLGRTARQTSLPEACRLFRKAAIAEPDNPQPLSLWGETELQADNLEKAGALFEAAYEMDPSPGRAADLAHLRHRQGYPAEAVARFRKVLKQERVYPWAWWRRAEAHWALGQHRAAARCLRIAIDQDPEAPHLVDRLSDLYDEIGQSARAIALLRESPLLATSDDLQYSLAVLLGGEGEWADALTVAERGMRQFPKDLRFGPFAAEALRMTDRKDEAQALLSRQAAENMEHAYTQARYGRFLLLEGEIQEGIERIDRALRLEPDWTIPLDWALSAAKQTDGPLPILRYLTKRLLPDGDPQRQAALARLWVEHDAKQAREIAAAALRHDSIPAVALGDVGDALLRTEDAEGALAALRQALRQERHYPFAWWRRSDAHWALGQRRAALRALRIAAAQDPDSPFLLGELVDRYDQTGQEGRALALLRESRLTTHSADLQYRLAALLLKRGRYESAHSVAAEAMARFDAPQRFGPLAADALRRAGKTAAAAAWLTQLSEQAERAGDADRLHALALTWLKHDAEAAVHWGERALQLGEQTPEQQMAYGLLLVEADEHDRAKAILQQVVSQAPSPQAFYGLAQIAKERDQTEERIAWLGRAVEAAEEPEEVRRYADELGDVLEEEGKLAEITSLMMRLEGRVDEVWRRTYLGYAAELTKQYDHAVGHFHGALELDPLARWAHFRLPQALSALGQHDEAIRVSRAAAERWPTDAGFRWLAGRSCANAGQQSEAVPYYREALKLNPDHAPSRYGLWSLLAAVGLPAFEAALADLPDTPRSVALWWAGEWWQEQGNTTNAVAAWQAAALADPTDADPHIRLAQIARAAKDEDAAWGHAVEALLRRPGAFEFARDMVENTAPTRAAEALASVIARLGDEHREARADLRYLLGETYRVTDRLPQAVTTWAEAAREVPGQRGSVWRLAMTYHGRRAHKAVVDLLAPLDEEDNLPADMEWLVVYYLRSSLAINRPRRPHWRNLILERIAEAQQALGNDETAVKSRSSLHSEVNRLRQLYGRLEFEFGNRRALKHAGIPEDRLAFAVRWIGLWLSTLLRRPVLDIRPGESRDPVMDGPIGGRRKGGFNPLGWLWRNPLVVLAFGTVWSAYGADRWPGLPLLSLIGEIPVAYMAVPLAVVLLMTFIQSFRP